MQLTPYTNPNNIYVEEQENIRKHFFDGELFHDVNRSGVQGIETSWQTNFLAVYFEIIKGEEAKKEESVKKVVDVLTSDKYAGTPLTMQNLKEVSYSYGITDPVEIKQVGMVFIQQGMDEGWLKDEMGDDDKIIAVAHNDPRMDEANSLDWVPKHQLLEVEEFFREYKKLEKGKKTEVQGWEGKEQALKIIDTSIEYFQEKYYDIMNKGNLYQPSH